MGNYNRDKTSFKGGDRHLSLGTSLCYRLSQPKLKSSSTFTWRTSFHQGYRVFKLGKDILIAHIFSPILCVSPFLLVDFSFPVSISLFFCLLLAPLVNFSLPLSLCLLVSLSLSLSHTHRMNNSFALYSHFLYVKEATENSRNLPD